MDWVNISQDGVRFVDSCCVGKENVVLIKDGTILGGGPGSSVGIGTDYGLDRPGSNSGGDEVFRPSRPTLVLTQPPVKWVTGLSRG